MDKGVVCAVGHDSWPTPNKVQQGRGACRKYRGKFWDAFYVVEHEDQHRVKFDVSCLGLILYVADSWLARVAGATGACLKSGVWGLSYGVVSVRGFAV